MQLKSRDQLKQLCFTTYVVTTMKSPHLLSSEYDLAMSTRSAQASQKRKDFITTTSDSRLTMLGRTFTQKEWTALPSRRFLQTSCPRKPGVGGGGTEEWEEVVVCGERRGVGCGVEKGVGKSVLQTKTRHNLCHTLFSVSPK